MALGGFVDKQFQRLIRKIDPAKGFGAAVVSTTNRISPLRDRTNKFLINKAVATTRERPHPWTTAHDYVSWTSLTDRGWSARHLPAVPQAPDLPPPEKLVDLFRRPDGEPGQLSDKSTLLFAAFAQYLTDGFVRSRMPTKDEPEDLRLQNTSTHNIDLCTLYGRSAEQTTALRLNSESTGQRGRLKSQLLDGEEYPPLLLEPRTEPPEPADAGDDGTEDDTFDVRKEFQIVEEFAKLDPPLGLSRVPDAAAARVLFAMGGDRVNTAPQVTMINVLMLREHNRLAAEIEQAHPDFDDTQVFETTRNCLIVMMIQVVVEEYINHISPLPFDFKADAEVAWDAPWNKPNWITTEFGLLYRWHSLIPDEVTWGGRAIPSGDTLFQNQLLLDSGLLQAFVDVSNQAAGQLGPYNTPASLIATEQAAIDHGRLAKLDSYTAYLRYLKLYVPERFEDLNAEPAVIAQLKELYRTVDDIDFYVGMFSERVEDNSPLPELILRFVAVDAFSQALTNPLLSRHVMADPHAVFTPTGWAAVEATNSLRDILDRNVPGGVGRARISMTQRSWSRR